jgi:hypothetical protein
MIGQDAQQIPNEVPYHIEDIWQLNIAVFSRCDIGLFLIQVKSVKARCKQPWNFFGSSLKTPAFNRAAKCFTTWLMWQKRAKNGKLKLRRSCQHEFCYGASVEQLVATFFLRDSRV